MCYYTVHPYSFATLEEEEEEEEEEESAMI